MKRLRRPSARLHCSRAVHLVLLVMGLALVFVPKRNFAHPMGNFSISHYAGLRIASGVVELRYLLDMAEIPTFQEIQQTGIVPRPDDPRVLAYLPRKAETLKAGLTLLVNGRPLALEIVSEDVIFPPGAGNLPTMKVGVVYRAALPEATCDSAPCTLEYHDGNFPERAGWKEIVATVAPGTTLMSSTAAASSRSQELANYPTDLINSPPQDLSARVAFLLPAGLGAVAKPEAVAPTTPASTRPEAAPSSRLALPNAKPAITRTKPAPQPGARMNPDSASRLAAPPSSATIGAAGAQPPVLSLQANKQGTPRNRFTELIASNQWGLWFLLTAALIAAALGGLHALEPGHGKTIVAAYLVGSQGTAAHALLLGLIVTATHTAGVYALGLVTLYLSNYIVPDHLYPWLGIFSGLTIAALGLYLLWQRYAGNAHGHSHHHHHGLGHTHHHHDHEASHDHEHDHDHVHEHGDLHVHDHAHDFDHAHAGDHHHHEHGAPVAGKPFSYRQLVALGVTGGIVPCPAALVVLLSAVALHRVAFGLYLIIAFSLGLAAVLISIGLVTVYARKLLARVPSDGPLIHRWLPLASAAVITCLGAGITVQALMAMGVLRFRL
jgi:nickel/cobalt exporter